MYQDAAYAGYRERYPLRYVRAFLGEPLARVRTTYRRDGLGPAVRKGAPLARFAPEHALHFVLGRFKSTAGATSPSARCTEARPSSAPRWANALGGQSCDADPSGPPFSECRAWVEGTQWRSAAQIAAFQEGATAREHAPTTGRRRPSRARTSRPCRCSRGGRCTSGGGDSSASRRGPPLVRDRSSGTSGHRVDFLLPAAWRARSTPALLLLLRLGRVRSATAGDARRPLLTRRPPYWVHNRAEDQLLLAAEPQRATVDSYVDRIRAFRRSSSRLIPASPRSSPNGCAGGARRSPCGRCSPDRETLDPGQRDDIEAGASGVRVFDSYGQTEVVVRRSSARARVPRRGRAGHHPSSCRIRPGWSGVVGTSLWNDVMPFIRYRTDDLVEPVMTRTVPARGLPCGSAGSSVATMTCSRIRGPSILPVAARMLVKPHLCRSRPTRCSSSTAGCTRCCRWPTSANAAEPRAGGRCGRAQRRART